MTGSEEHDRAHVVDEAEFVVADTLIADAEALFQDAVARQDWTAAAQAWAQQLAVMPADGRAPVLDMVNWPPGLDPEDSTAIPVVARRLSRAYRVRGHSRDGSGSDVRDQ